MKWLKLFGLALVALCASFTMLSASASAALPRILPEIKGERTWTGANVGQTELQILESSNQVVCKKAKAEGTEEPGKPLGLFHITFEECSTAGGLVTCTGLGDKSGVILALGKWHLVFDNLKELKVATLFLIEPLVHFECLGKLFLVLGSLLCLDLEPLLESTTHEFHCKNNGTKGDPEETTYFDANGKELKAELLSSEAEGKEIMSAQVGLGTVTYKEKVVADH